MFRFIALAWDTHDPAASATARRFAVRLTSSSGKWRCALDGNGCLLFHTTEPKTVHRAYVLHDNTGVILGNLFGRSGGAVASSRRNAVNPHETRRILESRGRYLVDQYWGRYVALLTCKADQSVAVLRDPTGAIPCLVTTIHDVRVVCSTMEERLLLDEDDLAINWRHIAANLCYDRVITSESGFEGVRQVRAGECVVLGKRQLTSGFHWNPVKVCTARTVEAYPAAVSAIRGAITRCVESWASCYKGILHELSGGLDSTVVLSCLSGMRPAVKVICQNYFTEGAAGDERGYARKAAEAAGFRLFETPLSPNDCHLVDMFESARVATPVLLQMLSGTRMVREQLAKRHSLSAIFSGQGGDHLFQRRKSSLIAADYARQHGMTPSLAKIVVDTAHLTGQSIWTVFQCAVVNGLLRRPHDPYAEIAPPSILSATGRDIMDPSSIRHPWVDDAKDVPSGKRAAIFSIVDAQNFYHSSCSSADVIHPLISQPVMELCLQIPSYVLTHSGVDRALVRDAFRQSIPLEIATRSSKGCTTSYFHKLLVRELPFLRSYLLDGVLQSSGLLESAFTQTSLRESSLVRNPHLISPLLNVIRAEAWLRSWNIDSRQKAA